MAASRVRGGREVKDRVTAREPVHTESSVSRLTISSVCIGVLAAVAPAKSAVQKPSDGAIRSKHYELVCECPPDEAHELSRVLEQAWKGFEAFFRVPPKPNELRRVRVLSSDSSFKTRWLTEQADLSGGREPAQYSKANGFAYVRTQPEAYATRFMLLYAACLQFHAGAESKNTDVVDQWYSAGIANLLARHTWDGAKLVLDATPLVSPFDFAARTKARLVAEPQWLPNTSSAGFGTPELSWSAVALCLHGGEGRYRKAFETYALGATGSKMSGEDFLRTLGEREQLAGDLAALVATRVQPLEALNGAWESRGERVVHGIAAPRTTAACAWREPVEEITATLAALPRIGVRAGFLSSYEPLDDEFVAILIDAPKLRWERWRGKRLLEYGEQPLEGDCCKDRKVRFLREHNRTTVEVDGVEFGPYDFKSGRVGFYVSGGAATFRDVKWR